MEKKRLKKEVIFMPNGTLKTINADLIKNESNEIVIRFYIDEKQYDLNLQSNNSEEIKKVFLQLSKQIRLKPIKIDMKIDKSIDEKSDNLFIEASNEYIKQLNDEMLELENDDDLKIIREFVTNQTKGENNEEK